MTYLTSSTCLLCFSHMKLENVAQFVNIKCLSSVDALFSSNYYGSFNMYVCIIGIT